MFTRTMRCHNISLQLLDWKLCSLALTAVLLRIGEGGVAAEGQGF